MSIIKLYNCMWVSTGPTHHKSNIFNVKKWMMKSWVFGYFIWIDAARPTYTQTHIARCLFDKISI